MKGEHKQKQIQQQIQVHKQWQILTGDFSGGTLDLSLSLIPLEETVKHKIRGPNQCNTT